MKTISSGGHTQPPDFTYTRFTSTSFLIFFGFGQPSPFSLEMSKLKLKKVSQKVRNWLPPTSLGKVKTKAENVPQKVPQKLWIQVGLPHPLPIGQCPKLSCFFLHVGFPWELHHRGTLVSEILLQLPPQNRLFLLEETEAMDK